MSRRKIRDIPYSFRPRRAEGSSDRYQVTLPLPANPPELSMGVFVKLGSDRSSYRHILNLATGTTDYVSIFHRNDAAQGAFTFRTNSIEMIAPRREFRMDKWYCVVARTRAGANQRQLWVDGSMVSQGLGQVPNLTSTVFDVGGTSSGAQKFDGCISMPFIIDRYITDEEIERYTNSFEYPDGCVGSWNLDEESLGTGYDSSGNGNDLTRVGSPQLNFVSSDSPSKPRTPAIGRRKDRDIKASLDITGQAQRVELLTGSGLPLYNNPARTIMGWIRVKDRADTDTLYSEGNTTNDDPFFTIDVENLTENVRVIIRNNQAVELIRKASITRIERGLWYHIAFVDNNGTAALYINGIPDGTNFNYTPSGTMTLNRATIGSLYRGTSVNGFRGNLSEVNLFDRALTQQEIVRVMDGELLGNVRALPLDEGAGNIAYDRSGNESGGSFAGAVYQAVSPVKARRPINPNLIYNGDFEFAPPVNVPQTGNYAWLDGTANGTQGVNRLFGLAKYSWAGTQYAMFDDQESHSGKYSLKLHTGATASRVGLDVTRATDDFPLMKLTPYVKEVIPGTQYVFSYWMKTQAYSGSGNGARAQLKLSNALGGSSAFINTSPVGTTTDWTKYEIPFTAPAASRYAMLRIDNLGDQGGTQDLIMDAWFDDIELRPTTPTSRQLIS